MCSFWWAQRGPNMCCYRRCPATFPCAVPALVQQHAAMEEGSDASSWLKNPTEHLTHSIQGNSDHCEVKCNGNNQASVTKASVSLPEISLEKKILKTQSCSTQCLGSESRASRMKPWPELAHEPRDKFWTHQTFCVCPRSPLPCTQDQLCPCAYAQQSCLRHFLVSSALVEVTALTRHWAWGHPGQISKVLFFCPDKISRQRQGTH